MCRHALFNKKGLELIEKEYGGVDYFLNFLVKERGGNGNGLLLFKDGKIIWFNKGLDFTEEMVCDILRSIDFDWALFHSRLATVAKINDANCHPFIFSEKDAASMNGTEEDYVEPRYDDRIGDETDAERVITELFQSGKTPEEFLINTGLSSCYLGFFDGKPFAATNYSPNLRFLTRDDAIIFASDFPWLYNGKDIYDVTSDDFYWEEGRTIPRDKYQKASSDKTCTLDGFLRQMLNKTFDTLITILSQKTGIPEEEFNSDNYTVGQILSMCKEYKIIDSNQLKR